MITEATGASCLDGTPPAFYFEPGVGDDAKNWVIFLNGGGWSVFPAFFPRSWSEKRAFFAQFG